MNIDVHVSLNDWLLFFSLAEHAINAEKDRVLATIYESKLSQLRDEVAEKRTVELDLDLWSFVRGWSEVFKAADQLDPKECDAALNIHTEVKIRLAKKFAHCHG